MKRPIEFDDIADIYDYYVTTDLDIPFYLNQLGRLKGQVLELMCGTGRVSIPLIKQGISLTCVDYSAKMLEQFKDKLSSNNLQARLVEADVCKLDLGSRFDAIFIPFHSFMELIGEQKQVAALERINAHLKDDGVFICTLHNPGPRTRVVTGEKVLRGEFLLPNEQTLVLYSKEQINQGRSMIIGTQYYMINNKSGELLLERQIDIAFSLIEKDRFEYLAKRAGFTVHKLYGDYSQGSFDYRNSPFMIYLLGKSEQWHPGDK